MLRKKISILVLCVSLLGINLSFNSAVFAESVNSDATALENVTSTKVDKVAISKCINEVVSLGDDAMNTGKAKDYSNIVKEPKLLALLNEQSKFEVEWFKKFNCKTDSYTSNVSITKLTESSDNIYVVDVSRDVESKIHGSNITSKSKDEKYRFEIKYEDGEYYITKMINLDDDINTSTKSQMSLTNSSTTDTAFPDYNKVINDKTENIDDKFQNIDKHYEYFKALDSTDSIDRNTKLSASNYSYNANAAVAYAHKYAYNPNYAQYPGSRDLVDREVDCTDFVSQCVHAGGIPASKSWYAYSSYWVNVNHFSTYMTWNGYADDNVYGTNGARAGDVVQFYNKTKAEWSHSVILTGTVNGGNWVYCGHSTARLDYYLSKGYAEGPYSLLRTIKFWH